MEMNASEPMDEEEEEDVEEAEPEKDLHQTIWQKGSNYSRLFLTSFYVRDPSMAQALKMKQTVEERLETFSEK